MADVLIDLGEVPKHRDRPADPGEPRAPFPIRALLGALSLVLVALAAGAGHHRPPAPATVIPARLGDSTFVVGDRLFVIGGGPEQLGTGVHHKIVSSYALPGAKLLNRTTVAVSGTITTVLLAGDTLMVSYQIDATGSSATAAVVAGTGETRWQRPTGLLAVSAADGLALLSSDGGRPGKAQWYAVDLRTGRDRWTVREPIDGYTTDAGYQDGYPRWLITATTSGHVETRDARTGQIITTATVPATDLQANSLVWTVGDLLMLGTGSNGVTAYTMPGLHPLWYTPADLSENWAMSPCGPVICAFRAQRKISALDPATGRLLWDSERWAYAEATGSYLVATRSEQGGYGGPKLTVLDPWTGAALGDFGGWEGLATSGADDLTYAMQVVPGKYVVYYGVLDPARLDVEILGSADGVSTGCETSAGALVCRLVDASVAVWRLG